jgi:hypothetical protein
MATLVLTDVLPRLIAAGRAVRSAHDAHQAELELRDDLVVAAVDHGINQREVARAAGVSVARISAILANSQPDD